MSDIRQFYKDVEANKEKIAKLIGESKGIVDKEGNQISMPTEMPKALRMSKEMETGHIDSIAKCRLEMENAGEDAEMWALEVIDMDNGTQYFMTVNATSARHDNPDMPEIEFQRSMINSVTGQLKVIHKISAETMFYCLFVQPAYKVAGMKPIEMHKFYVEQLYRLSLSINGNKDVTKDS